MKFLTILTKYSSRCPRLSPVLARRGLQKLKFNEPSFYEKKKMMLHSGIVDGHFFTAENSVS